MRYTGNLGFLFYKHYYRGEDLKTLIRPDGSISDRDENNKNILECKNKDLYSYQVSITERKPWFEESTIRFRLNTTYPGLVIGTGITHEVGADAEIKIGFQFDYTTGLPIIPGSSVKGLLRSAFPNHHSDQQRAANRRKYIQSLLKEILDSPAEVDSICVDALEREIFDGITEDGPLPMRKRDIFFAAEIYKGNKDEKILGEDYITPHPHSLKSPIPLRFVKVLPDVSFEFKFDLKESLNGKISPMDKCKLFKLIICDLGIGAKTNVGYGYMVEW